MQRCRSFLCYLILQKVTSYSLTRVIINLFSSVFVCKWMQCSDVVVVPLKCVIDTASTNQLLRGCIIKCNDPVKYIFISPRHLCRYSAARRIWYINAIVNRAHCPIYDFCQNKLCNYLRSIWIYRIYLTIDHTTNPKKNVFHRNIVSVIWQRNSLMQSTINCVSV